MVYPGCILTAYSLCKSHLKFSRQLYYFRLMMTDETTNPWQVKGSRQVYDNKWINVTEYDVINPSGGKGIYGKIHFKNTAIGVLALDDAYNTYLVGQYRFALNEYSWEIPEGGGPEGTSHLEAAKRELLEETGLIADNWQEILRMHLSNSVSDELSVVFIATGLRQKTASPEETEQLIVKKLPFDKLYKMVMEGSITDAITVATVMKAKLMMLEGRL